ncbi:aldehyde dehydrogenase [Streptomyces zingiberis]|uniref:Aldehyde dehydrogenase n=1 Tax=Streptomyces zingiberis TaxID=2053010 RepID=A0ABX1C138_9ACTN|nr:aldehyde dehydrogenase [Streptomyces zingiberis]NJQ01855.1 aldehyde dehydrogenase [Streptomyces zingiberis]
MMEFDQLWIGGAWAPSAGERRFHVRSPHDGAPVGTAPEAVETDIDRAVDAARRAGDSGPWPRLSPGQRQEVVARFGKLYEAHTEALANLVTDQNGSAIWFSTALQKDTASRIGDFVDVAAGFDWERVIDSPRTLVRREPVGVVAAIVPWNAPQNLALAKVIPALLAGCPVILKPSPETPLDGLLLGELFAEAGLPDGIFSVLPADREVSEYLVRHPGIDKIAFTGSTAAGRRIAAVAGEQLKRVSLELGGKSAAILLPDADLEAATAGIKSAAFLNNGSACIAHTRILVHDSQYERAVTCLSDMVAATRVGDPKDPATFLGPMVSARHRDRVRGYIELGITEGARLVTGGPGTPEGLESGNYIQPTLFADVDNAMRIAQEEIFGPVLTVLRYRDEAEAVAIANDSAYGLSGGVWTADHEHGLDIARRIRTGGFHINGAPRSPRAPFGGFKDSGIGREYGPVGLGQYTELKSIGY